MQKTDFLVIGSGIAGLTYALKVAHRFPEKKVIVMTKAAADETNTKYAQGGIAVVNDLENDSFQKHIDDTLIAGDGLCNRNVVEIVVKEGPDRVDEIINWGAKFDKEEDGDYKRGKEGGHSEFRILHHKDVTGKEMERALLDALAKQKNIEFIKHCFVVDIITQHHLGYLVNKATPDVECFGVYVLNLQTNKIEKILSKITLLATGGNGQVYRTTTNPSIATAMGWRWSTEPRAGSRIWSSSSFIQLRYMNPGCADRLFLLRKRFAVMEEFCGINRRKHSWSDMIPGRTWRREISWRERSTVK
jgi:L-aspartate oxidase